jgi:CBS domain containing-hemolysin-like protein
MEKVRDVEMTQKNFRQYFTPIKFFIFFCLLSILFSIILDQFVISEEVFYKSYAERYSYQKIQLLAKTISTVTLIFYILTPILYLIRFKFVALFHSIVDFLRMVYKIGFLKTFQVAMFAEIIFLLPDFIGII